MSERILCPDCKHFDYLHDEEGCQARHCYCEHTYKEIPHMLEIARLTAQLAEARAGLEFYGERENWKDRERKMLAPQWSKTDEDHGDLARRTLAKMDGGE